MEDVVIVGAGILGIYQLYRARQEGHRALLLERGSDVGGVWHWNRYPGCRFDSESYTYAYLFDRDLFDEWRWSEHFAAQPETERYLQHVVDRYDLRKHIRFGSTVTSAEYDDDAGTWGVWTEDGFRTSCRYLISTTGVLSVPSFPDVPGRDRFAGVQHHTGEWPADPVDFDGKRVAVVGTGSSGVQIAPVIADRVGSLTVFQRTPSWCTPLNNRPINDEEQARLRNDFERMKQVLDTSITGFLHESVDRRTFDDDPDERQRFYERMWDSPGFSKLTANYADAFTDPKANKEFCDFLEAKIRGIVQDQDVADLLIPEHGYGGLRPPFVNGWYEMFNRPNVELVSLKRTRMTRVTPTGIETADGQHRPFDVIVWATGFDFGTGALLRMGIRGTDGLELTEHWADGPTTFLGVMTHGFPNLFFPGGPHGATGNNPRYGSDQVDFVAGLINHAREHGVHRIEAPQEVEDRWMATMERFQQYSTFIQHGQYWGGNTPGKARRFLLNPAGRLKLFQVIERTIASDYAGFLS